MSTHFPKTPQRGEDILPWARELSNFVRQLIGRESADMVPTVTSVGTSWRLRKRARTADAIAPQAPFYVVPADPPDGEGGDGWVKVLPTGTVIASIDPTNNVAITGLDSAVQLNLDDTAEQYVWIQVDVSPLFDSPPGLATGKVDSGADWNGDSGDFFPVPVEFNTDDGTPEGSGGTPPDDLQQITVYWPLARTYDVRDNPFPGLELPGAMLTEHVKLVNIGNHNLRLFSTECYKGKGVTLLTPWHGAIPG